MEHIILPEISNSIAYFSSEIYFLCHFKFLWLQLWWIKNFLIVSLNVIEVLKLVYFNPKQITQTHKRKNSRGSKMDEIWQYHSKKDWFHVKSEWQGIPQFQVMSGQKCKIWKFLKYFVKSTEYLLRFFVWFLWLYYN